MGWVTDYAQLRKAEAAPQPHNHKEEWIVHMQGCGERSCCDPAFPVTDEGMHNPEGAEISFNCQFLNSKEHALPSMVSDT